MTGPLCRRIAALFAALLMLAACRDGHSPPLDQQLYVWQRQWTPAHAEALRASHATFSTLRVLALQAHPGAGWSRARIDTDLLRQDGRPWVAVVRLDGQLPQLDSQRARDEIGSLLADWQRTGLTPVAVEIDHDCASARLADYARFLGELRASLPTGMQLGITALPAWLSSPRLPDVLAQVDGSVLQVHGVSAPEKGLFDERQALEWARRWDAVSPTPFLLALPAYGAGLIRSDDGVQVESEAPLPIAGARQEWMADPQRVAGLVAQLRRDPPAHLAGLIWFRLPLPGDRRAWPLATLMAVARGEALAADLRLDVRRPDNDPQLNELTLANLGNAPAALPARLQLAAHDCFAHDALPGYRLVTDDAGLRLEREAGPTLYLQAGQRRALGWARCHAPAQGGLHAQP